MKKVILLLLMVIILFGVSSKYKEDYYIIPEDSIRIRIVPNSNNPEDQYLKQKVKENIEASVYSDLKNSKTIENSRNIINSNLNKYDRVIKGVLAKQNSNQKHNIDFGYHYFPEKVYKGVKYKEGNYESLLITLGKGEGDNWWCVLFPPLCSLEVEENNIDDVEYSSYVMEMFAKYLK